MAHRNAQLNRKRNVSVVRTSLLQDRREWGLKTCLKKVTNLLLRTLVAFGYLLDGVVPFEEDFDLTLLPFTQLRSSGTSSSGPAGLSRRFARTMTNHFSKRGAQGELTRKTVGCSEKSCKNEHRV